MKNETQEPLATFELRNPDYAEFFKIEKDEVAMYSREEIKRSIRKFQMENERIMNEFCDKKNEIIKKLCSDMEEAFEEFNEEEGFEDESYVSESMYAHEIIEDFENGVWVLRYNLPFLFEEPVLIGRWCDICGQLLFHGDRYCTE